MHPDLRASLLAASLLAVTAPALAQPVRATAPTPPPAPSSAPTASSPPRAATVVIPAAPPAPPPLVRGELTCSHGALRALVVSDLWSRLTPACERIAAVLPHGVAAPGGVPDLLFEAVAGMCARGGSVRALCGLDAHQRDLLVARVEALSTGLEARFDAAQRLCGAVDVAEAVAPSAPEAVRDEVREAVTAVRRFCAQDEALVPTERQSALTRLAREVSQAAVRANLTADAPATTALWASIASGPGAPGAAAIGGRGEGGHGSASGGREAESARADGGLSQGLSGIPTPMGVVEVALRGLAELLQSRAQAELEGFMLEQLREVVCSGAAAPWFEYTCAYLVAPDAALRTTAGSALRRAFQSDVMAFPRRIAQRAPMTGDAQVMLGSLWFKVLAASTESRSMLDLGDRFADVGGRWTCADRDPNYCERARKTVQGAGFLIAYVLHRDDLAQLSPNAWHAMVETVFGRGLSTDALAEVEALRGALLDFRQTFAAAQVPGRVTARNPRGVAAVLADLRPLFVRAASVAFFDDPNGARVSLAEGLPEMYAAFTRADLTEIAVQAQRAVTVILPITGLPPDVLRGMILAAEVAMARSPEQVRAALESAVAPPGAWRLKRRRTMLSITGLVGVAGGGDLLLASGISSATLVPTVGLVGALGLDVSFPVRTSTLGLYVSVIDLGGLLSLPLGDARVRLRGPDGVERAATLDVTNRVSIEQVLAPGLFFRWGIGRSPFVFAAGASMIPFGRSVQEANAGGGGAAFTTDATVLRVGAMLAVDLTLLPF